MAILTIGIRTDYLPSQINNIDILIAELNDMSQTQFRIMTDFPDHLNLRDGVVLTKFGHLKQGEDYTYTMRVFLNEAPFVVHQNVIVRMQYAETESRAVINAI
jgi:hypothetical protein